MTEIWEASVRQILILPTIILEEACKTLAAWHRFGLISLTIMFCCGNLKADTSFHHGPADTSFHHGPRVLRNGLLVLIYGSLLSRALDETFVVIDRVQG